MAKNNNLTDFLTGVADAIRRKRGTTGKINPQNFEEEISGIPTRKPEEEKTVALYFPGGENQLILPTDGKVMSKVTVKKPSTLIRSNIRDNVIIGGVVGTLQERKPEQSKSVTITTNGSTRIFPDSGKVLSEVIVTTNVSGGASGGYTAYFVDGIWIASTVTITVEYADGSTETLTSQNDLGGKSRDNVVKMTFTDTDSERYVVYKMPASGGSEESLYLMPTATLVLTADVSIQSIDK